MENTVWGGVITIEPLQKKILFVMFNVSARGCSEFCVNPIMLKRGETHVKGIRL
jgi:hypothetical protein